MSAAVADDAPGQKGINLALAGHCPDATPLFDEGMRSSSSTNDIQRSVALAGVRCSMLLDRQNDAMSFSLWLQQAFPKDLDVLVLATHVFSELTTQFPGPDGYREWPV
ncbi:MAG TPA: hypothetical protein VH325_00695 [Bryobacteraceae bacterium]|jgi:hypothetical protein|nr:hypothetical protein [Bryobacteraceae bacterium]